MHEAGPPIVDVPSYLHRIAFDAPAEPTSEALRSLHRAHLYAVPFENLDIHLGRLIVPSVEPLLRKVVGERRGGFCYELNGAFAALLEAVGFEVRRLSARVARADGRFGPEFDHLVLEVAVPIDRSRWLVDVGFGEGFLEPLPFVVSGEDLQANGTYRIDRVEDELVLWRLPADAGEFEPQYRFSRRPHDLADFAAMCRYHQTSPDSHFTRQRVCSRATPDGRVTLTEIQLITTRRGHRTEEPVDGDAAYRAALREHFGIEVSGEWLRPASPAP